MKKKVSKRHAKIDEKEKILKAVMATALTDLRVDNGGFSPDESRKERERIQNGALHPFPADFQNNTNLDQSLRNHFEILSLTDKLSYVLINQYKLGHHIDESFINTFAGNSYDSLCTLSGLSKPQIAKLFNDVLAEHEAGYKELQDSVNAVTSSAKSIDFSAIESEMDKLMQERNMTGLCALACSFLKENKNYTTDKAQEAELMVRMAGFLAMFSKEQTDKEFGMSFVSDAAKNSSQVIKSTAEEMLQQIEEFNAHVAELHTTAKGNDHIAALGALSEIIDMKIATEADNAFAIERICEIGRGGGQSKVSAEDLLYYAIGQRAYDPEGRYLRTNYLLESARIVVLKYPLHTDILLRSIGMLLKSDSPTDRANALGRLNEIANGSSYPYNDTAKGMLAKYAETK